MTELSNTPFQSHMFFSMEASLCIRKEVFVNLDSSEIKLALASRKCRDATVERDVKDRPTWRDKHLVNDGEEL